jgi:cob(I)alamin adenosyltransferase
VDELNATLGVAAAVIKVEDAAARLRQIQSDLFSLGAELATQPGQSSKVVIGDEQIHRLERWIDEAVAEVPALRNFVLPGGSEVAARLHSARTVCRRAERATVTLNRTETLRPSVLVYLNRLSDLLFVMARVENHRAGVADIPWTPDAR